MLTKRYLIIESLHVPKIEGMVEQPPPNPYKYEIERFDYTKEQLDPAINSRVSLICSLSAILS